jgi:hypothetical protein
MIYVIIIKLGFEMIKGVRKSFWVILKMTIFKFSKLYFLKKIFLFFENLF